MTDEPESHSLMFLGKVCATAQAIDATQIEAMAERLAQLRYRGRLFVLGVGGSAANASHAVNDFRKLCDIEAYAPTDNVAELTARTNDDGWETVFVNWLKGSRIDARDAILVFSVSGGDKGRGMSINLANAVDLAKGVGALVLGVVGAYGGHVKAHGDIVVHVPTVDDGLVTPMSEAFQAVIWHALVCHPKLAVQKAKWEGMDAGKPSFPESAEGMQVEIDGKLHYVPAGQYASRGAYLKWKAANQG